MAYLFDTSVLSIAMSQQRMARHPRFARWLATVPRSQQHTSIQVVGELLYGAQRHPDPARRETLAQRIAAILAHLTVLSHDRQVAERYADLRTHLERVGTPVGEGDLWIGACAAARGLSVVTANVRHFDRMPGVSVEPVVAETAAE